MMIVLRIVGIVLFGWATAQWFDRYPAFTVGILASCILANSKHWNASTTTRYEKE